jgi:hypothetical protein
MRKHLLFLSALTIGVAATGACSSDDPAEANDVDVKSALAPNATSTGTIDGKPVVFREAAADSLNRLRSDGVVTLAGSRVQLSSGQKTCTEWKKNAQQIEFKFQNNEGDILPGSVYKIGSSETLTAFSTAHFTVSGEDCGKVGDYVTATSGEVTITHASTQSLAGSYEFRFGNHGTVKGTFVAPTCLKTRDYDGVTPACKL